MRSLDLDKIASFALKPLNKADMKIKFIEEGETLNGRWKVGEMLVMVPGEPKNGPFGGPEGYRLEMMICVNAQEEIYFDVGERFLFLAEKERLAWTANSNADDAFFELESSMIPSAMTFQESDIELDIPGAWQVSRGGGTKKGYSANLIQEMRAPSASVSKVERLPDCVTDARGNPVSMITMAGLPRSKESYTRCAEIVAAYDGMVTHPAYLASEAAAEAAGEYADECSNELSELVTIIVQTPAESIADLRLKARALAWRNGDWPTKKPSKVAAFDNSEEGILASLLADLELLDKAA